MKTFRIEIATGNNEWRDGGTIRGKSPASLLRRAYNRAAGGIFDRHRIDLPTLTVFHSKYTDWPIIRLVPTEGATP